MQTQIAVVFLSTIGLLLVPLPLVLSLQGLMHKLVRIASSQTDSEDFRQVYAGKLFARRVSGSGLGGSVISPTLFSIPKHWATCSQALPQKRFSFWRLDTVFLFRKEKNGVASVVPRAGA